MCAAPSAARLLEILGRMAGQPVAMLVDMVADRFITGTPKRISREAPVLILRYDGESGAFLKSTPGRSLRPRTNPNRGFLLSPASGDASLAPRRSPG